MAMNKRKALCELSRSQAYKRMRAIREQHAQISSSSSVSSEESIEEEPALLFNNNTSSISGSPQHCISHISESSSVSEPNSIDVGAGNIEAISDQESEEDLNDDSDNAGAIGGGGGDGDSSDHSSSSSDDDDEFNLREQLAKVVVKNVLSRRCTTDLLNLLRRHQCFYDLPKTRETLVRTPREKIVLRDVPPGKYYHFTIKEGLILSLKMTNSNLELINILYVTCNMDGVSLCQSSTSQFLNILGKVNNLNGVPVFKIGIYHGYSKPDSSDDLLEDFVVEGSDLCNNGLLYEGKLYQVRFNCFVCDLPAKAFVLNVRGHNFTNGCTKCEVTGQSINKRMSYQDSEAEARTDEGFRNKEYEHYHLGESPLERVPFVNMIKMFPIDPMHQIYIGTCKKILKFLFGPKPSNNKLNNRIITSASEESMRLRKSIPCEFQRRGREMERCGSFKATECRLFLLYTGPIILRNMLDGSRRNKDIYDHFMGLHVCTYMLNRVSQPEEIEYCGQLFLNFVRDFGTLYGVQYVSQNIHSLTHIAEDAGRYGELEKFSAFLFENENGKIRRVLKDSPNPLLQVVKRHQEEVLNFPVRRTPVYVEPIFDKPHHIGPLTEDTEGPQYKEARFKDFMLTNKTPNNCFMRNQEREICLILNFATDTRTGERVILARAYRQYRDLYTYPRRSSSLHIYVVHELTEVKVISLNDVKCKCLHMPFDDFSSAVFPMAHTI